MSYVGTVGKVPFQTNLYQYTFSDPVNYVDPQGTSAYDLYSAYQTTQAINQFQTQIANIRNQISQLDEVNDCEKNGQLNQQANTLTFQLARTQAAGSAKALATAAICAGLAKL